MAIRPKDGPLVGMQQGRPGVAPACEVCRKLKMRCIRSAAQSSNGVAEPCERCKRSKRTCRTPQPRPLGRRPGARGRYQGFEKAYRKMQAELRKARASTGTTQRIHDIANDSQEDGEIMNLLLPDAGEPTDQSFPHQRDGDPIPGAAMPATLVDSSNGSAATEVVPSFHLSPSKESPHKSGEPINNPLALLADASGAAQALSLESASTNPCGGSHVESIGSQRSSFSGVARQLLNRPGYVSLGLKLGRESLEQGLETLFIPAERANRYSNYFRPAETESPRDVGPDLDPVDLGLISMEEVYYLFPIYFSRLHPINGILDATLHVPDFVRSRSALLFTWILALTAQFDSSSGLLAKRLRLHGEKLSRHVHSSGYKSVEIVQGYYISLLSAAPANTMAEERLWLYTNYAFGLAAELGLDQRVRPRNQGTSLMNTRVSSPLPPTHGIPQLARFGASGYVQEQQMEGSCSDVSEHSQRLARNRERTWLRILLWERANSAACGRVTTFPDNDLIENIKNWWLHPVADPTDKHTCAFILLRQQLAALHNDIRIQAGLPHSDPHWARELVNAALQPWSQCWISPPGTVMSPSEQISNIFLYYVYIHGRLWTLCFALYISRNTEQDLDGIREDCFEAAVSCCEVAVRDLQTIGEPLYCMLAPTWAMISYAAVLALQIFPLLHGTRAGYEVELLALLAQVALQLERAGTTPSHRFGIAALVGQHLLMILRAKAAGLRDLVESTGTPQENLAFDQRYESALGVSREESGIVDTQPYDSFASTLDPFFTSAAMSTNMDIDDGMFADLWRELFGQGFGGAF